MGLNTIVFVLMVVCFCVYSSRIEKLEARVAALEPKE